MGVIDFITDIVVDTINNNRVAKANRNRRGITLYKPAQIDCFVEDNCYQHNTMISGGSQELRSEVLVNMCVRATNANIPVIILHQGDTDLVDAFNTVYGSHASYCEIGPGKKKFDPFYRVPISQISRIIVDTAPSKYNITSKGRAYVDAMTGFLDAKGRKITLEKLYKCPHHKLSQLIGSQGNVLSQETIHKLQTNFSLGQPESPGVISYIEKLYQECSGILPSDEKNYSECVSIFEIVKNKMVLNFDIISESNTLLLKNISEHLQVLIRRREEFLLILDNISIKEDNTMKTICSLKTGKFHCVISGNDAFSMCEGEEQYFGSLVGSMKQIFLFHHGSGISAGKWSDVFSKYIKIDKTYNYGRGANHGTNVGIPSRGGGMVTFGGGRNYHEGIGYHNIDEYIIRPEEIINLPPRGGFIYTDATRELAKVETFLPL